jgi:pimeloyl-ACP methyl ester carboxylesterase
MKALYNFLLLLIGLGISTSLQAGGIKDLPAAIETPTGTLKGSLMVPAKSKGVPVVLLIAGSGPTDRNGNNPMAPCNNLRLLARFLADNGVASLRYDKRGIANGSSVKTPEADLRFDQYVSDARAWIDLLAAEKRFNKIIVAGHSEGSLIGMIASQNNPKVAGYISIAGPGRPADVILKEQMAPQAAQLGTTPEAINLLLEQTKMGQPLGDIPAGLQVIFHASILPYLQSWMAIDPRAEIAKVTQPILILQGKTDIQVMVLDAENLAAANPKAKILLIDEMNHTLKKCASLDRQVQLTTYADPSMPLHADLTAAILAFVRQ